MACRKPIVLANGPVTLTNGGVDTTFNFAVDRGQLLLAPGATLVMKEPDEQLTVSPEEIPFSGFEGAGCLLGADLDAGGAGVGVQLNPFSTGGVPNPELQISLTARPSGFDENEDFIRILADPGNDGDFEISVAEFLPVGGLLTGNGIGLTDSFQEFIFSIPSSDSLVLRIEANSTAGAERIGDDNIGVTIPEPTGFVLLALGVALLQARAVRRRTR